MYWEMLEDYLYRRQTLKNQKIIGYKTGYIDGVYHHLGPKARGVASASSIPGYKLWMELTIETIPEVVGGVL
jgi:hypothetical protein